MITTSDMNLTSDNNWRNQLRSVAGNKPTIQVSITVCILVISIGIGTLSLGDEVRDNSTLRNHLKIISLARQPDSDFFKRFNASLNRLELASDIIRVDPKQANRLEIDEPIGLELVRLALSKYRDDDNLIILLVLDDRVVLNAKETEFLEKFETITSPGDKKIVFARDSLRESLTPVLNSRAMIGQARALWELFNQAEAEDKENVKLINDADQYCGRVYADESRRLMLGLVIDEKFEIFQSLADFTGQESKLKLVESLDKCELHNLATLTKPIVVLPSSTSATSTHLLNSLGNYLGLAWSRRDGSSLLNETLLKRDGAKTSDVGGVLIGLFILEPTPFLGNFFELVLALDWPKEKLHLILYNSVPGHQAQVDTFRARVSQLPFASFKILTFATSIKVSQGKKSITEPSERSRGEDNNADNDDTNNDNNNNNNGKKMKLNDNNNNAEDDDLFNDGARFARAAGNERRSLELQDGSVVAEMAHSAELEARSAALEHCKLLGASKCDYYLHLESLARIRAPNLLQELIGTGQTIVAPLLSRPSRLWANFWGSQTVDNYYARSFDYVDLVRGDKLGLWAVNLIRYVYLIEASFIRSQLAHRSPLATTHLETSGLQLASIGDDALDKQQKSTKSKSKSTKATEVSDGVEHKGYLDRRQHYLSSLNYLAASPASVNADQRHQSESRNNQNGVNSRELEAQLRSKFAISMAKQLHSLGKLQFVLNTKHLGHLVDPTSFNLSRTRPDLYQLEENILDWEREYLHPNYSRIFDIDSDVAEKDKSDGFQLVNEKNKEVTDATASSSAASSEQVKANAFIEEPCRDVYWFPLVSEKFTQDLIAIMEAFGEWSSGTNDDPRIEGGYESVPTRDIHFRQVGLHELWLSFLRSYVMPVQLRQFIGYEHDPPRADLAFVVRYHPAEQPSLRAHHDSSTYTLNIALNSPQLGHYEGGGCRFVRQNCSVTQSRAGWALIHPGRLTHYHEGLPVRAGTRYILVTFIDP